MLLIEKFPWLLEPSLSTITIRVFTAIVCAGIIGYERDTHGAPAGFRTHILVCLGAVLAMSTGQFAAELYEHVDATRIGAQVISGIGFLGAGSIIVKRNNHISGLTTAAGLWASACIGLAIGIGFYEAAIVGAIGVYVTEKLLHRVNIDIKRKHEEPTAKKKTGSSDSSADTGSGKTEL